MITIYDSLSENKSRINYFLTHSMRPTLSYTKTDKEKKLDTNILMNLGAVFC